MVFIPTLHLNMAHIQAYSAEMDFLPEMLRFTAMWCRFSQLRGAQHDYGSHLLSAASSAIAQIPQRWKRAENICQWRL